MLEIHYLSAVVAAVAAFVMSSLWYTAFGNGVEIVPFSTTYQNNGHGLQGGEVSVRTMPRAQESPMKHRANRVRPSSMEAAKGAS
jgi:hypothetical protein